MPNVKPNFEVESSARMASEMEEAEGNAAVDSTTEENGDFERLFVRHRARKITFGVDEDAFVGGVNLLLNDINITAISNGAKGC